MLNRALIVVCMCVIGAALPSGSAIAQTPQKTPTSTAKDLAREGLKLARSKKFQAASERFEAAFKLDPQAIYAHNLARSFEELGELTKAYDFFSTALRLDAEYNYAAEGRRKIGVLEKRLQKTHGRVKITTTPTEVGLTLVEADGIATQHLRSPHLRWVKPGSLTVKAEKLGFTEQIASVKIALGQTQALAITLKPLPKKGYLNVSSSQKGATVQVDGKEVGKAPVKGMVLEAGNHRITVAYRGSTLLEREIVVVPDKSFTISHNLPERISSDSAANIIPTALWITSGVLCIASVGLHIAAADQLSTVAQYPILDTASIDPNRPDYSDVLAGIEAQNESNQTKANDARSTGQSLEVAAWIGYGVAASAALVGTLLYIQGVDNPPQSTGKEVPSYTLLPTMNVGIDRSTFGLSLSF